MEQYLEQLNRLTKGLVGYIFRDGIAEDMHADGYLSGDQMKLLDVFMVDRLGYCLHLLFNGNISDLFILIGYHVQTCKNWNNIDLTVGETELNQIKDLLKKK